MANFKSGLLIGALIGAGVALLNAPKSGEETRKDLKLYIDQTQNDVTDVRFKLDNLKVAVDRLSKDGIPQAQTAVKDLQSTIQKFTEDTQPRVNRIQNKVTTLQNDITEAVEEIQINK